MPTTYFLKLAAPSNNPHFCVLQPWAACVFLGLPLPSQVSGSKESLSASAAYLGVFSDAGDCDLSAIFSAPPVESRDRYGKNGVISNSIFSRAEVSATGLALESST